MAKKANWNKIAKQVAAMEGKKVELPIGQIKEVIKCLRLIFNCDQCEPKNQFDSWVNEFYLSHLEDFDE